MDGTKPSTGQLDTFPSLLIENASTRGNKPAMREKGLGIWQTWTWSQVADEIKSFASGLTSLGFTEHDRLAIVGDNRPQLYWAMVATQLNSGVPVPVYQDSVAEEMLYVLKHADVRFAVVEDQEQVDKILEIKDRCPKLEHIIYTDTRGMRDYKKPFIHFFGDVQSTGQTLDIQNPSLTEQKLSKINGSNIAIILYTSGTTGNPKGVMLSHQNLIITAKNAANEDHLLEDDEVLAYLPMAWVGDNLFSLAQAYVTGFCVSCPESSETVLNDLKEIGPTYFFAPPRIFENILTTVTIRMEDAAKFKRIMFKYFMEVAGRVGSKILDKGEVSIFDRLQYIFGNILIFAPLKNVLGFSRIRVAYTAGEAIGPEIFEFYRSLGINIKQLYGSTEASVFITMQRDGEVQADTVGKPAKDVEIRIEDTGEVMFKSPGAFTEYYKDETATSETKTHDGWIHTGDAGFFDTNGNLKIIDRAKDVGKLQDGSMFAPKYIENKLKFFPFIKEAVAFGDQKDFVAVFINIDLEAVGNYAERKNLPYSGYTDLASRPEVYHLVKECIENVNSDLSKESHLSGSQIKRYLILHKELDADDGELTRTRKVRRQYIIEKYGDLVSALYSDTTKVEVEAKVTFEDGRTGKIRANVAIEQAKTSLANHKEATK